jgi:hypothetical protein
MRYRPLRLPVNSSYHWVWFTICLSDGVFGGGGYWNGYGYGNGKGILIICDHRKAYLQLYIHAWQAGLKNLCLYWNASLVSAMQAWMVN